MTSHTLARLVRARYRLQWAKVRGSVALTDARILALFTAKPWGPFVPPLTMAAMWLATPLLRRLSPRRQRIERFPGAFEFRMMLTIGVVFVIWMLVVSQSVSWFRTMAVPLSVGLIVAGIGKVLAARS